MNQDQRELFELAAYAIGYKIGCRGCGTWGCVGECEWNPLTNKANAFDLMVKLELEVYHGDDEGPAVFVKVVGDGKPRYIEEMHNGNPEAATMLALTRAAAAIGKQMKGNGE